MALRNAGEMLSGDAQSLRDVRDVLLAWVALVAISRNIEMCFTVHCSFKLLMGVDSMLHPTCGPSPPSDPAVSFVR